MIQSSHSDVESEKHRLSICWIAESYVENWGRGAAFAPEVKVLRIVALEVSRDADELNHVGMGKVVHDVKLLMLFEININLS